MRIVKLIRQKKKENVAGQPGKLYVDGKMFCYTLELDWRQNQTDISCIPTGIYECKKGIHHGAKVYEVPELQNVPERKDVEIHIGNFLTDIKGCILLGKELKIYKNKYWVKTSTVIFNKFMDKINEEDFLLEITYIRG